MKLYFSTPVWGDAHIELFHAVGLPSLLAPGNLPSVDDANSCKYYIYTRSQDIELLTKNETFKQFEELMSVEIKVVPEPIKVPHETMSWCHADTLNCADQNNVATVFIPPDCVWANGSLARVQELANSGKSVVHMCGVRLDRNRALHPLRNLRCREKGVLDIKAEKLVGLGLQYLHPIALSHFWREFEGQLLPANLYWTVPDQGLLLRCFHLHPLMVKSQIKFAGFSGTIDDDLALAACPDVSSEYVVRDSDEILAFEISAPSHSADANFPKCLTASIAAWTEIGTNRRHRQLAEHTIRLHHKPIDPAVWAPIEAEADKVMRIARQINARWTPLLAVTHPRIFAWRMYAKSLGVGLFAGQRNQLMDWMRRVLFSQPSIMRTIALKFLR